MCIAWKLKISKIYGRKSKVHVQHKNCNRCSLAPLARKNLVLPHNLTTDPTRSQIFRTQSPYRGANASGSGTRLDYSISSERSERSTIIHVSQTSGLARRDNEIFATTRGASSFHQIAIHIIYISFYFQIFPAILVVTLYCITSNYNYARQNIDNLYPYVTKQFD